MVPLEIRQRLLQPHGIQSVSPIPPGLSGARLLRCEGGEQLVLKCWPESTSVDRIREIHSIMEPVSLSCALLPKFKSAHPGGASFTVDRSGRVWELVTWMPGSPLAYEASLESIQTGAIAIRQVHDQLRRWGGREAFAPAIGERIERVAWLDQRLPRCFGVDLTGRVHPSVLTPLESARDLLRTKWPVSAHRIIEDLSPLGQVALPLQYVLRDVHREHVLFTSAEVGGIIDFDAVRIDTPAADLARWVTSFAAFPSDRELAVERVLAGYFAKGALPEQASERSQFSPTASDFRTLVGAIANASLWISLANWVVWLVDESRQFPDFRRVALRLSRLIDAAGGQAIC